jgi:hypothetical protein
MASNLLADFFAKFTIDFEKNGMTNIENEMNKGRDSVDKFGQSVDKVSAVMGKLKLVIAGFVGFEAIKKTFDVNAGLENTKNQLINATKSPEIATAQLQKVIDFAHKSRMSIKHLTDEFGKFQQQMSFSDISVDKSLEVYKKLQVAYAGASISDPATLQRVQKGVTDFIAGTASMAELKQRELGDDTIILQEIEKRLGGKKVADAKLKGMTAEQRAELISDSGYSVYKDGVEAYLKSPKAALINFKNEIFLLQEQIGNSGFTKLAVKALNFFSLTMKALKSVIEITGYIIEGFFESFKKAPAIMWSVVGAITAITLALNANKIAMLANIVVTNIMIIVDGLLAIAAGKAAIAEILMTLPLWLIVAGVIAVVAVIALLVEDIMTHFQGGKSVFGLVVNKLKELFNSFINWFSNLGTKISNWIYNNSIEWVNKFSVFGTKISLWLQSITKKFVDKFADFGLIIGKNVFSAFTIVKDFLISIFTTIKDKYFEYVINPIIKFASKISGKLGKVFENIKADFLEINPKINQPKLNEILANVIPKAENYRDYRSAAPMIYPMQKPNNNVTSTYSPNININVTSNNALNENDLASKIKLHLTDAIDSHYSLSLADATGGG